MVTVVEASSELKWNLKNVILQQPKSNLKLLTTIKKQAFNYSDHVKSNQIQLQWVFSYQPLCYLKHFRSQTLHSLLTYPV